MNRVIDEILLKWKEGKRRKPLLLRGARQVGKTYSVRQLGRKFDVFLEINFEEDPHVGKLFKGVLSPDLLCRNLSAYCGKEIIPGRTLLFFDEVQSCPEAILSLRYFYEKLPELHLIATGSLLEFALEQVPSMGVGRIKSIFMYPLSFNEFLKVSGEDALLDMIQDCRYTSPLPSSLHSKALNLYKTFQLIGGLPEVVNTYLDTQSINLCFEVLDDLIITFKDDFAKYKERANVTRIAEVFSSAVHQAGGKFKYSRINAHASQHSLKATLELLEKAGILYKITHTSANGVPLGAEVNHKRFKVILFDTGIHQRLLGLNIADYISVDDFETVNRGGMAELFTGLEILKYSNSNLFNTLYYWHREAKSSNAEIDYVIQSGEDVVPIEVKSGKTGTLKSLHSFMNSHASSFGIKVSMNNFSRNEKLFSIPLYAIGNLFHPSG